jgi:hypothetical protein
MSVFVFALVNAALAAVVVGGIVGMMLWSVVTQHRDHGCQQVRLMRRRSSLSRKPLAGPIERPAQELVLG